MGAEGVLGVDLVDEMAFQEVIRQRFAVTQALDSAVHVARVCQVLKSAKAKLRRNLVGPGQPTPDLFVVSSAIGHVELLIHSLALSRAVVDFEAPTDDHGFVLYTQLRSPRQRVETVVAGDLLEGS